MVGEVFKVKEKEYQITKFLGKGKSGYSYLIESSDEKYVLKMMHDEPCPYYHFDNKLKSELGAYERLKDLIHIPLLVEYDLEKQYLIKEYFEGDTAADVVAKGELEDCIVSQIYEIADKLVEEGINIDYFPTNFVIQGTDLVYVDYEYNNYMEQWDFENWGIYYWFNSKGMKEFLETNNILAINESVESGIPIKAPFIDSIRSWKEKSRR